MFKVQGDVNPAGALTKYPSREVLDKHVTDLSLKWLAGRAVTAPRAQLQLESTV